MKRKVLLSSSRGSLTSQLRVRRKKIAKLIKVMQEVDDALESVEQRILNGELDD